MKCDLSVYVQNFCYAGIYAPSLEGKVKLELEQNGYYMFVIHYDANGL